MKMSNFTKNKQKNGMIEIFRKREFWEGQLTLLFSSRLKLFPRKLKYIWPGPFTVHKVFPHGEVQLRNNTSGDTFKVNGQRLNPYLQRQKSGLVEEA